MPISIVVEDVDRPKEVALDYVPRPHFVPVHNSDKRWIFITAHRRAGKTVALANHLIRAACRNKRRNPPPRYCYIAPSFEAAKDLVWSYLKSYTVGIPGMRFREGELIAEFQTGATIRLYGGGTAFERMRGIYADGAVLDEFALLHPSAFTTVVRPCLADYRGFAIVSGTPNGADDHFATLKLRAEADPAWEVFEIPITVTGESALSKAEVEELTRDMSADEFAREMMCSFESPVEGAYYSEQLNSLALQNRVAAVPVDLTQSVLTGWDLGIHDFLTIWLLQICGREYHWIDYLEARGKGLDWAAEQLQAKASKGNFVYRAHLLPHDLEAREISTGQSRRAFLVQALPEPVITVPRHDPDDGIKVARNVLGLSWFDRDRTRLGLSRLRAYKRGKTGMPVHDDASHGADGFRTACVGLPLVSSSWVLRPGRLRRKLRGLI